MIDSRSHLENFSELKLEIKLSARIHEQDDRKNQTLHQGKSNSAGLGDCYCGIYVLLRIADVR